MTGRKEHRTRPMTEAEAGRKAAETLKGEDTYAATTEAAEQLDAAIDIERELSLAREQAAAHLEVAQRVQAEFENFRKRMAREQEDAVKMASQRVIDSLLPVIDNLDRAIEHASAGGDVAQLLSGVEMIRGQIMDILGREGVELLDPLGQRFDPMKEQAVGQREDPEMPEGTVVDVYQKGFRMYDRVIRPAMVIVSTGGPAEHGE